MFMELPRRLPQQSSLSSQPTDQEASRRCA